MATINISMIADMQPDYAYYRIDSQIYNTIPLLIFYYPGVIGDNDNWDYDELKKAMPDTRLTDLFKSLSFYCSTATVGYFNEATRVYDTADCAVLQTDEVLIQRITVGTTISKQVSMWIPPDITKPAVGGSIGAWSNYGGAGYGFVLMVDKNNKAIMLMCVTYTFKGLNGNPPFPMAGQKGQCPGRDYLSAYPSITNSRASNYQNAAQILYNKKTIYDPNNPYRGGDDSTDPGDGEFDYGGDEIDIPDEPTVSVADSGFVSLFAPSESQLNALAKFMWSDTFSLASFKKLFNNPMDCILGLSIVPVNLPTGTAKEITVGNIVSTVKCNVCTKQFVTVNCGSLTISPTQFTGGYLDYSPYTKCYIYLPFIGIQQLNIDDVMNSTVNVVYHVDILTGACVCYLKMTNRTTGGRSQPNAVLYTFSGQCAESVPLSSTSFSQTMGSILTAAGAIGGAVATIASGGAAAPVAGALTTAATSTANAAVSMKPNIQHSGSLGGSSGFMNIRYPFMIFDCPHTAIPQKQYEYTGFPSNSIVKLSELSGFNIVQAVNLSVKGALDTECDMIKSALESGVIF